jgi:TonB C terminal
MSREAHIPLALWISAAIVAHLAGGGGAAEVAQVVEDRAELRALTRQVREQLRPPDTTFEVLTDVAVPTPAQNVAPPENTPKDDSAAAESEPGEPDEADKLVLKVDKPRPPKEPPETAKTTPQPPPPEPPKPTEKVAEVPLPIVKAPPPPPPPEMDHRIAVRQNVKKDQADNPSAHRIADDANHTDEETMARVRSHDQDDPNPTPGTHSGPKGAPGNSDHDKVAHSEDKKGDETHAPGEARPSATGAEHNHPAPPSATAAHDPPKSDAAGGGAAPKVASALPRPAAPSPGGAGPASPEVVSGDRGSYTLDPVNPGGDGKSRRAGKKRPAPFADSGVHPSTTGFNKGGPLNLPSDAFEKAVGREQLRAERAADGASRRSAHRGAWETNKFERWRAAIENYEPTVKLGNQTSLNAARVPFATYINSIHNRLHPIFGEEFLSALDGLPKSHPLQKMDLVTHVEIVLSKDQGRIVRMGVTRASGITAFDVVALNSISRAQPFGKAPDAIISPDGNVYLHWEFHRDPFDACTTRNARPFLLKSAPPKPPEAPAPPKKPEGAPPADDRRPTPGPILPLRSRH